MDLNVSSTDHDALERTYQIMKAPHLPRLTKGKTLFTGVTFEDFRTKKLANAMRLAGYEYKDTIGGGAKYRMCLRYCTDRDKDQGPTLSTTNH